METIDYDEQLDPPMRKRSRIKNYRSPSSPTTGSGRLSTKTYDPTTPLRDPLAELYIQEIIANGGVKKTAYEKAYYPHVEDPEYSPSAPYSLFNSKVFQKRYNYVLKQALQAMGIDNRSLLFKTAVLIDDSVQNKSVKSFTMLVDTVLKLEGLANPNTDKDVKKALTTEDMKPIRDLLEELNG